MSVVIPLHNEEGNVRPLLRELRQVLDGITADWEVILVDDGSSDGTVDRLREELRVDPRVKVILFARRFGQTAALAAGFDHAKGEVVVAMDGDLQNDPADIPLLLLKLDEPPGWDVVNGWRRSRHDGGISRRLPSLLANGLARRVTGMREIRDFGCGLKAYRWQVLRGLRLYGEMHRFLPVLCKWQGARVAEIPVRHRPRVAGESKYGLRRTTKVLLDLVTLKFLGDYLTKPIYFFGKLAFLFMSLAAVSLGTAAAQKLGYLTEHGQPVMLNNNVFFLAAMMCVMLAVIFVMMGVFSELLVRLYHEALDRRPYRIREVLGAPKDPGERAPDGMGSGARAASGDRRGG